jgi:prevent-host-death family protein
MNLSHKPAVTLSSREFNQDTARAKRAAKNGPVFITDRGKPSHVLMSIEEFERLKQRESSQKKKPRNLAEALADKRPGADFDWEPPKMAGFSLKIPDLE